MKTFFLLFIALVLFLFFNQVPTSPTSEDVYYCEKITELNLDSIDISKLSISGQIDLIHKIQTKVRSFTRYHLQIPFDEQREPKQLYEKRHGYCFDRSRTIEKSLTILGFKVRHVSLYLHSDSTPTNFFHVATMKHIYSHAVSEVWISDKWMYVGSNQSFLSVDKQNNIYNLSEMRMTKMKGVDWKYNFDQNGRFFQQPNSLVLYGLYSRHGRMYPPYLPFPDINYKDFLYNFTD